MLRLTQDHAPLLRFFLAACLLSFSASIGHASVEDTSHLLSADSVLAAMNDSSDTAISAAASADPELEFRARITTFVHEAPDLSDQQAAHRWLGLLADYVRLPLSGGFGKQPLSFMNLWDSVPSPRAWPYLAKELESDSDAVGCDDSSVLRLLAAILVNDQSSTWRALRSLIERDSTAPESVRSMSVHAEGGFLDAFIAGCEDSEALTKALDFRLRMIESRKNRPQGFWETLSMPDLVTLLGREQSEPILKRALALPLPLVVPIGIETRRLAVKLAIEMDSRLRAPQWHLAESLDGFDLYQMAARQFPPQENDLLRKQALAYYILGLITRGRAQEAADSMAELSGHEYQLSAAFQQLESAGHGADVSAFLHELLVRNPGLGLWDLYAEHAVKAGSRDELLDLARKALTDSPEAVNRIAISHHLLTALLASDRIEEASSLVNRVMDWTKELRGPDTSTFSKREKEVNELMQLGQAVIKTGEALNDSGFIEKGFLLMRTAILRHGSSLGGAMAQSNHVQLLAAALMKAGRYREAQDIAINLLKSISATRSRMGTMRQVLPQYDQALLLLADIYHQSGRHADALVLFEHAELWSVSDVAQILGASGENSAELILATALAGAGRREESLRVTQALLERLPGFDPAYELLIELAPLDVIDRLDALYARDPFEERPLIWKASVLLARGRLDEAENTARRAVAVDPSDGEQGPGRRMRAYAVLRDVMAARGDSEGTLRFSRIISAIRTAEDADRLLAAGLVTQAIARYTDALEFFSDAYCIQSRLSVQLSRAGRMKEAEEHYRRAFELMPESFGRLESHCFGCERVFAGEAAENAASAVFTRLVEADPANARATYLLGYLREEQQNFAEALRLYERATSLDSDYIGAWLRLARLADKIRLPSMVRRNIAEQTLRLDPAQRHVHLDAGFVDDPQVAWRMAEQKRAAFVRNQAVFALHQTPHSDSVATGFEPVPNMFSYANSSAPAPAKALQSHPLIRNFGALMDMERSRRMMDAMKMMNQGTSFFGQIY